MGGKHGNGRHDNLRPLYPPPRCPCRHGQRFRFCRRPLSRHPGQRRPGAETIAELFGDQPALILLDELSIYLRKIKGRPNARDQLTAFLTSLFKAVESSPRATLVYTLAGG